MPVENGPERFPVLRVKERGTLLLGEPREGLVRRNEDRPAAVRCGLGPILSTTTCLNGRNEGREAPVRDRAQRIEQVDGRRFLHAHAHRILRAGGLRQNHPVDGVDHAVATENIGSHDLCRAETEALAVRGDRLAVARRGASHLRVLDVADLHREEPAGHHVVGDDAAQLLLVLGKQQ